MQDPFTPGWVAACVAAGLVRGGRIFPFIPAGQARTLGLAIGLCGEPADLHDRLLRQTRELERFIDLCDPRGVPTLTVTSGHLALSTPTALSVARVAPAGLSGDTYAMFAGGTDASVVQKMTVEAYGTTLARTVCASLSANAFSNIMYGYVGFSDYFVISSGSGIYQVYNKSLVMTTIISSPIPGQSQSACATADRKRALFMGFTSGKVPVVVSMDSTLTIRAERATSPVVQNATGTGFQNWVAFTKGTYYNEAGSGVYNHAFTRYRYIA